MKISFALAAFAALALAACNQADQEAAEDNAESAASDLGEAADEAGSAMSDAAHDAGEAVEGAVEKAATEVEHATDDNEATK